MKFHNMVYKIKQFCDEQQTQDGCDNCPLLDKRADTCILHAELPCDWDVKKIKEVLNERTS